MKLSRRLSSIANFVETCSTVADIGTDHAFIPIYLISNKFCTKAIASDVKKGPASKAKQNIKVQGLEKMIEVRVGNGLSVLKPGEAEVVIIAGMGGRLIANILQENSYVAGTIKSFILQPMTHHFELREWLKQNSYKILDEDLVEEDGKIYIILKVAKSFEKEQKDDCFFGRILFEKKHPLLTEYITRNIKKLEDVKQKLIDADTESAVNKVDEVSVKIRLLSNFLNKVKNKSDKKLGGSTYGV